MELEKDVPMPTISTRVHDDGLQVNSGEMVIQEKAPDLLTEQMEVQQRIEAVSEGKGEVVFEEMVFEQTVSNMVVNEREHGERLEMLIEQITVEEKASSLSAKDKEVELEQKAVRDGRNKVKFDKLKFGKVISIADKGNRENGLEVIGAEITFEEKSLASSSKEMDIKEEHQAVMVAREERETVHEVFNSVIREAECEQKEQDSSLTEIQGKEVNLEDEESDPSEASSVYSDDAEPPISEDGDEFS